jgi:hypothetical protein
MQETDTNQPQRLSAPVAFSSLVINWFKNLPNIFILMIAAKGKTR